MQRVLTVAHHHDAADDFAFAVQLRHAAPDVRAEMHRADVFHINRCAVLRFERDVLDVGDALDVAASPDVILGRADFKNLSAHIAVGHTDFVDDLVERNAVGGQLVRVEVNLVLLHETADGRDFGDTLHRFKRVAQIPVLE